MSVRRKQSSACLGVSTIGSFSLKLVLSTSGMPVRRSNDANQARVERLGVIANGLHATRAIDVSYGRNARAHRRRDADDVQHERIRHRLLEIATERVLQHRASERPKRLAQLDLRV